MLPTDAQRLYFFSILPQSAPLVETAPLLETALLFFALHWPKKNPGRKPSKLG